MGLIIQASVVCDKDLTTTVTLQNVDGPLPNGWARVQGYANIAGGDSEKIDGYFCPTFIQTYGTKDLVKRAADISPDLTAAPVPG